MSSITVVRGADIPSAPSAVSTSRWTRRVNEISDRIAINEARNEPGATSAWHHHGDNIGCVYVVRGQLRIDWGTGGRDAADLAAGDFYVLEPRTVHRETNPGSEEQHLIAFVIGKGARFVNVERPDTASAGGVHVIRSGDIPAGPKSDGMTRRVFDVNEQVSLADARIPPGSVSGWHHHDRGTTCVYIVTGRMRLEWGVGGRENAELTAGDFYVIAPDTIHRESNPGTDEQRIVGFYLGSGNKVVNVQGPGGR
jgi:uncharacterized RmlC-like cupin family protein